MIIIDAGPLVALLDDNEPRHQDCRDAAAQVAGPMVTTWPAFTEAMHLLGRRAGFGGQSKLWHLLKTSRLEVADLTVEQVERSAELMQKYSDVPMALADATLVAVAESRRLRTVFTLDGDFMIYRLHGRRTFEIVPS